jgi:hypothetical protein
MSCNPITAAVSPHYAGGDELMTSETTATRTTAPRAGSTNGDDASGNFEAVQAAMREVRGVLGGVGRSMPDVARASRTAVDDLVRTIETGSDERVSAGVSLSLGLAIGMLIGGAPRVLIALALAPVAIMGLVSGDRKAAKTRTSS